MSALALKFRSALIAIVVLLLSAGLVFAGGGFAFLGTGSGGATDGSAPLVVADGEGDEEDGVDAEGADDHGDLVSEAAQMATPEDFKNHGAFVSCVARMVYLDDPDAAEVTDLADLKPEHCDGEPVDEVDPEVDTEVETEEDQWDNHGDLVSDAAGMATPAAGAFKNHGAFVSCVARMTYGKKGSEAPAGFSLEALTATECDEAEDEAEATADEDEARPGKAKGKGPGNGKGNGKGRGR